MSVLPLLQVNPSGLDSLPLTFFPYIPEIFGITLRGTRPWYRESPEHYSIIQESDIPLEAKGRLEILEFDYDSFNDNITHRFSNALLHPRHDSLLMVSHLRVLKLNGRSTLMMQEARNILGAAIETLEVFI
jgi:hypothetical protein